MTHRTCVYVFHGTVKRVINNRNEGTLMIESKAGLYDRMPPDEMSRVQIVTHGQNASRAKCRLTKYHWKK